MRVIVVGPGGTIGAAVTSALERQGHQVIPVSRSSGIRVDIENPASIKGMFGLVGRVEAVVCCAGLAVERPLFELSDEELGSSVASKLIGQINLVRFGLKAVTDDGAFVLTSGIFARQPSPGGAALALGSGGVESFTRAAALELPRGIRINAVSPPIIKESAERRGEIGAMAAAELAGAYVACVEGKHRSGQVIVPE